MIMDILEGLLVLAITVFGVFAAIAATAFVIGFFLSI